MTERGPKNIHGVTNISFLLLFIFIIFLNLNLYYYIPIYDENDENVEMILWFFDSMSYGCLGEENSWGCIYPDVIDWYTNKSNEINKLYNRTVKGLAFFHIPQSDFYDATYMNNIVGNYLEKVCCPLINTGLITAMVQQYYLLLLFIHFIIIY